MIPHAHVEPLTGMSSSAVRGFRHAARDCAQGMRGSRPWTHDLSGQAALGQNSTCTVPIYAQPGRSYRRARCAFRQRTEQSPRPAGYGRRRARRSRRGPARQRDAGAAGPRPRRQRGPCRPILERREPTLSAAGSYHGRSGRLTRRSVRVSHAASPRRSPRDGEPGAGAQNGVEARAGRVLPGSSIALSRCREPGLRKSPGRRASCRG